ncbi:MAG: hypothetical protein ACT4O1_15320 [Gemmatimonadota bacterium]
MATETFDELNATDMEAPGGTQVTHPTTAARAVRSDFEREIREHPLRSVVLALAGGYILARLLD